MKETWDAKQLVPYISGPYNQPKAGVENVRSMKYKVSGMKMMGWRVCTIIVSSRRIISNRIIWVVQ
jgi:hypothetical protein